MEIINKIYFSIFVFSLIVFVDLMIKFKRPIIIKFNLCMLSLAAGCFSLMMSLHLDLQYFFFISSILKGVVAFSIINLFTILYFPKLQNRANVLAVVYIIYECFLFNFIFIQQGIHTNINIKPLLILLVTKIDLPLYLNIFRILISLAILTNILYLCYFIIFKNHQQNIYFDKIKIWVRTIIFHWFFIASIFFIFPLIDIPELITHIIYFFIFLILELYVFYRPVFLNRSSLKISFGNSFNRDTEYAISELDFINEFYTNLYFAKNDASLENLSKILNISSNDLYKFIYYKYSMTFNDLVNKNRVDYFIDIIHNPNYLNYTIDALAKEAGFSSRQHLYKPFKKFHGGNPSDIMDALTS